MTLDEFPDAPAGRPVWLITLADLALLLVGFFVFLQASQHVDRKALANGFRAGFGVGAAQPATAADAGAMPVAAAAMLAFAPGSAALPSAPDGLVAWSREAARDPRVALTVTGSVDGSRADVDPATGSGTMLAADRARAVAAAIAVAVPDARLVITTGGATRTTRSRRVVVTLGFAGSPS